MGVTIEMVQEPREVSTIGSHVPNPDWVYTDSAGHKHRFEDDTLPTLVWVVTATFWCPDCRDEHDEGEWRCRQCKERVDPGYNWTGPQTIRLPGLASFTLKLDGKSVEITEEQATGIWSLPAEEQEARARALFGLVSGEQES